MQRRLISIIFCSLMALSAIAQDVIYEYWMDNDYQKRVVGSGGSEPVSFSIDASVLSAGTHILNFRAKQCNGSWGSIIRQIFVIPDATTSIGQYECWLDDQYDRRVITQHTDGDIVQSINLEGLSAGIHYYNVRAQDNNGDWGALSRHVFFLPEKSVVEKLRAVEYWLDSDSLNSTFVEVNDTVVVLNVDVSQLTAGKHAFNCRIQNGCGLWSDEYAYEFALDNLSAVWDIEGSDGQEQVRIFNLSGVMLKEGKRNEVLKDLPRGIYIINGKKLVRYYP